MTDSVTIRGNGSLFHGANGYVNLSGNLNPIDTDGACPIVSGKYILVGLSQGLVQVGERNADNSGIELTIENWNVNNTSQLIAVRNGAKATLRDVTAEDIRDVQNCTRAAITAFGTGSVTLEGVEIRGATNFTLFPSAIIEGVEGKLELYDSIIELNLYAYAVAWGGDADIVSSIVFESGGLWAAGAGGSEMRVINSLFLPSNLDDSLRYDEGFLVSNGGAMTFTGSTVVYNVNDCPPAGVDCNWSGGEPSLATFQARQGVIQFEQSAIHVLTIGPDFSPSQTPLLEAIVGFFTADQYTFIQPLPWQNAAALNALVLTPENVSLITGADALPVTSTSIGGILFPYPVSVTPIITGDAILVGAVPLAGPGQTNELKDGRGNTITTDVLGAPRVTNGARNIGAVENDTIPYLLALIDEATPFTASLFWNQPASQGITGYDLCQGIGAPPSGLARTTGACPGDLIENYSTDPAKTTGIVPNLPPDSSNHWFFVRAVAGNNKEPWSNLQEVQVLVTVSYPSTQLTDATQITPIITGPLPTPTFYLSSGTLPAGLSLDPTTGTISGVPSGTCRPTTVGILLVASNGVLANTTATLTCPPVAVAVPVLQHWAWILLTVLLFTLAIRVKAVIANND